MSHTHQPLQPIIQHLFQVASLEEISRQRLESFVGEYPSFGIGHYLLSHKLRSEDPEQFLEATQKTCLYFSNPLWLQWLLENSGTAQSLTALAWPTAGTAVEIPPADAPGETAEEMPPAGPPAEEVFPEESPAQATPIGATFPEGPEPPSMEMASAESPAEEGSAADRLLLSIEEAKGLRDSLEKINEDFRTATEEPIFDEETPFVLDAREEPTPIAPLQERAAPDNEPAPTAPSDEPAPAPTASTPPTPDLVFEPYHTIDYFASQGIRLTLDENPGDKLGKQLKSFTEWLKVMRRLPQKDRESVPDRVAEQAVQNFAAHSIESKDVVTETMAEVLVKQGMYDRARVIYEKLSLLNPDKRSYFAGKIEQLNIR